MLNAQLIFEYLKSDIGTYFFCFVFQIRIKSNQNLKEIELF